MIRSWIPGYSMNGKEQRYGDVEVIISGDYCLIIDGGCEQATDKLIAYLKRNKIKKVYLLLTHAHYDHFYGLRKIIRDSYFEVQYFYCYDPKSLESGLRNNKGSREVRSDINELKGIIGECNNKKIKVKYLKHEDKIALGDIKFDGSENIYNFIKELGLKVKFFKIPHHGNNCTSSQAKGLKAQGAYYCWYNDLEPRGIGTNDFTLYGARRCREAGIKIFTVDGDINWVAQNGQMVVYKDNKYYSIQVKYKGGTVLKQPTVDIVRNVFMGKYGAGNTRNTKLLDAGYYPTAAQRKVNLVIDTAKKIISGKLDFGKNIDRIEALDKAYGKGYGQLIQDEINSLLNAKSKKW